MSVFIIDGIDHTSICGLGLWVMQEMAKNQPGRTKWRLYGWARFAAFIVHNAGLRLIPDNELDRHANIVGWPDDIEERLKIQQHLASLSCPVKLEQPLSLDPGGMAPPDDETKNRPSETMV